MVKRPLGIASAHESASGPIHSTLCAHPHTGIFIALGSNLGDRERIIRDALREIERPGDIRVVRCSTLHETEAVGGPPGQGRYLNAVAELTTQLTPRQLLLRLLAVERHFGRERGVPCGPRTLDLDLLLYGEQVIDEPDLIVPHPRMWERPFVTGPLGEICDVRAAAEHRKAAGTEPQAPANGSPAE